MAVEADLLYTELDNQGQLKPGLFAARIWLHRITNATVRLTSRTEANLATPGVEVGALSSACLALIAQRRV
jgi:hypothetical protein